MASKITAGVAEIVETSNTKNTKSKKTTNEKIDKNISLSSLGNYEIVPGTEISIGNSLSDYKVFSVNQLSKELNKSSGISLQTVIDEEKKAKKKAVNTTVKVLSNGGEVKTIDLGAYVGQEFTPTKMTNKDLVAFVRTNFQGEIANGVDLLINNSIDKIVEDQIGLKTKELMKTDVGLIYQEGKAVYEKILKSEQTLLQLRGAYTKGITESVNNTVNGALNKLGNKGVGGFVRNFLVQSKLAEVVTGSINLIVTETIKAVASDQMIKNVSKQMIDTVKAIKKQSLNALKTTFKNQIEYVNKLKKAIKDKFKAFEDAKKAFLKKITDYISDINEKISKYLTKITKAITDKVASLVAGALGGITKGLSF